MDALPGYTYFNQTKKVLCVMQIIKDSSSAEESDSVMKHEKDELIKSSGDDAIIETDSLGTATATTTDSQTEAEG
jgi:hypothetical protein